MDKLCRRGAWAVKPLEGWTQTPARPILADEKWQRREMGTTERERCRGMGREMGLGVESEFSSSIGDGYHEAIRRDRFKR
jgi:hypothetical protein